MQPRLPKQELTDEQRLLLVTVSEAIASLEETEPWGHFVKAAESLIEQNMPQTTGFEAGKETWIASKIAYISGIKDCLAIVKNAKKRASDLKK